MITAYTEEIDEAADGIAELLGQIDLGALKKNSVGIVTCHRDFARSDFVGELHKRLPFSVIGMTTMTSANPRGQGMYSLSLSVLTSDELVFETAVTKSLSADDYAKEIEAAYSEAAGRLPGDPSLIVTLFPLLKNPNSAEIHKCLDEVCGGIPIWGGVATHTDTSYNHCRVLRDGGYEREGMAMLLIHGPIDPEFVVVSLPLQNIHKTQGEVTSSDGCVLKEINRLPAVKYLETLGIVIMENAPMTTPLMIYYEGTPEPVALAIYAVNGDGSVSCGGEIPMGASVAVGEITAGSVMASAGEAMDRVLGCGKRGALMVLPCVSRYMMLGDNPEDEIDLIAGKVQRGGIMPYMLAYSGGEICPVRDSEGVPRNRFHNFTFSVCAF